MPSKSPAQAKLMAAISHGWPRPAASGISVPVKVAREFNAADQAKRGRPRKSLAGLQK